MLQHYCVSTALWITNIRAVSHSTAKSHLARVESLQSSNIHMIVRCFQTWWQVKKRPFTMTDIGYTQKCICKTDTQTMYKYTNHDNQYLIFMTNIRPRPIRACKKLVYTFDDYSKLIVFNLPISMCKKSQMHVMKPAVKVFSLSAWWYLDVLFRFSPPRISSCCLMFILSFFLCARLIMNTFNFT